MALNRRDLQAAYSILPRSERQRLCVHMNSTMGLQRRYFLEPYSEKIGKGRLEKLLAFYPEEKWKELAEEAKTKALKPIELNVAWPELTKLPDIIIINGQKYTPIIE